MAKKSTESPMFRLTPASKNHKTGKMAVSTSPMWTYPDACPFKGRGCYSGYGPIMIWWKRCSEVTGSRAAGFRDFLNRVDEHTHGECWRHNQAGDLVPLRKNMINPTAARALAQTGKGGYTYTHYPVVVQHGITSDVADHNRAIVEELNETGFTVNVSCNSPAHLDKVAESGIKAPLTTILPEDTQDKRFVTSPGGRKIIVCPAVTSEIAKKREEKAAKKEGREPKEMKVTTCDKCGLCMNPKRKVGIGFPAHGTGKKRCEEVLSDWETGDLQ